MGGVRFEKNCLASTKKSIISKIKETRCLEAPSAYSLRLDLSFSKFCHRQGGRWPSRGLKNELGVCALG